MHVLVSLLNFRPGKIGGTETYLRKLIPELANQRGEDRVTLLCYPDNAREIIVLGAETVTVPWSESQITRARALEAFTPYRALSIERQIARLSPDVVFFPQQSIFPKRTPGRIVMTVLDLQHIYLAQNFARADKLFRAAIYPYSLRRADHLLAISEFTRGQLMETYRLPSEKVSVAHLGFEPPDPAEIVSSGLSQPYLYYPAASHPHKNHWQLFDTIAALHCAGKFPYRLVLSGIQTKDWPKLSARIAELQLADVIEHVGYVTYPEVQGLYCDADAILFPTTYEGFGLPILEGIAAGRRVIASRLEIFRELGLPEQWMIDFGDQQQLLAALSQPGPTKLEQPPPTWAGCANATWHALRGCSSTV